MLCESTGITAHQRAAAMTGSAENRRWLTWALGDAAITGIRVLLHH